MIKSPAEPLVVYLLWMKLYILNRKVSPLHTFLIWIRVTSLEYTGLQSTLIGKAVLNILILLDDLPQEKSKTFCVLMQKAGITMMYLFKNFILQHVDNLLCFIFIKDVLGFNFEINTSKIL